MSSTGPIIFSPEEVRRYCATRLPKLIQHGGEWRGPCSIHNGQNDNFAVEPITGRWFCHSKCGRGGDIVELERELTGASFIDAKAEIFRLVGRFCDANGDLHRDTIRNHASIGPSKPTKHTGNAAEWQKIDAYSYTDAAGHLIFEVVRYRGPHGEKGFRQRKPDGKDGWIWNLDGIERAPYRLPKVLAAESVYLPEGEKDVHTLEVWGVVASCNSGGSGSSDLFAGWLKYFQGRHVVILPDNDEPGYRHALDVAKILLPVAASVRVVELPGLPPKGDVTDWRDAGGTLEQLQELTKAAPFLDRSGISDLITRWGLENEPREHRAVTAEIANEWPKPEPIRSELPSVEAFSEELLPVSFRPLVQDMTERMQVPIDYPAVVLVLCLAGAVNRRASIQPKANDTGWIIVPNLWGGIIAPPGFMKSPVIQAATRPLNQIQAEWRKEHDESLAEYVRAKEEHELKCAAWKEQYKASAKKGKAAPDRPEDELEAPKLRRLIVNDATFEALHQTMSENPAGTLVIRDELTGWWSQLDRTGREGERAFCLQSWNGDTEHTIDRIGRGTIHVDACCMSMLGGIQPGRLRSYLVDALRDGPSNDGLIQRFQLLVWPDTAPEWAYVDRAPDAASEQQAAHVFRKLVELDAEEPARYRFAPEAQELFVGWLAELEGEIRGDQLHPALTSHLSKYRKLMPALALLFELSEWAAGNSSDQTVSLEHARQAAAWCEYLKSHSKRVYSCVVSPQMRAARELADKIRKRKLGTDGFFSCRDVYLKGWTGLDTPEAVKHAAEVLQDAGWLREVSSDSGPLGGRPSNRYLVNPGVWR